MVKIVINVRYVFTSRHIGSAKTSVDIVRNFRVTHNFFSFWGIWNSMEISEMDLSGMNKRFYAYIVKEIH